MQMKAAKTAVAAAAVLALAGCEDVGALLDFESDRDAEVAAPVGPPKVSVVRIDELELGRLFSGFMLTAVGVAPALGYYAPELRPRFGGELGPDGFYEFDFVAAAPPEPVQSDVSGIAARRIRADFEITPEMLRAARGVRVWSARGNVEGRF